MPKKFLITLAALTLIFSALLFRSNAQAASLTFLSDTLTRLQINTLSSHTIQFNLPKSESFDAKEIIQYDFGEDDGKWKVDGVGSSIEDFKLYDGIERTIVGVDDDCFGHKGNNDVTINIDDTSSIVSVVTCENFVSSSSGATVILKYGKVAGGIDRVTNPAHEGSTILTVTHFNSGEEINFGKLAVPIMKFDGVSSDPSGSTLGIQTSPPVNSPKLEPQDSPKNQDQKSTIKGLGTAPIQVENCFQNNFANSIPTF